MKKLLTTILLLLSFGSYAFEKIEMRNLEGVTDEGEYCEVSYTIGNDNGTLKTTYINFTLGDRTILDEYVHDIRWSTPGIQVDEGLFSTRLWQMGEPQLANAYTVDLYGKMTNPRSVKIEVRNPIIDRDRFFLFMNKENSFVRTCYLD